MKDKKEPLVDLHVHSMFSDGIFTPEEIVDSALRIGLKAIALTDHDSVDGVQRVIDAAKGNELEIVPGVELSANISGEDIHMLGYFIDWKDQELLGRLKQVREGRKKRMYKMLELLSANGIKLDQNMVFEQISNSSPGRLHLAKILLKEHFISNLQEAFDKYIGNGKPCYVGHERLDYIEAIGLIKKTGGIAVLAHPGKMGKDEFIPRYVDAGLSGIEVFCSKHRHDIAKKYFNIAKKHGLVATGGSDCHGNINGTIMMGSVRVKYEVLDQMKRRVESQCGVK